MLEVEGKKKGNNGKESKGKLKSSSAMVVKGGGKFWGVWCKDADAVYLNGR